MAVDVDGYQQQSPNGLLKGVGSLVGSLFGGWLGGSGGASIGGKIGGMLNPAGAKQPGSVPDDDSAFARRMAQLQSMSDSGGSYG